MDPQRPNLSRWFCLRLAYDLFGIHHQAHRPACSVHWRPLPAFARVRSRTSPLLFPRCQRCPHRDLRRPAVVQSPRSRMTLANNDPEISHIPDRFTRLFHPVRWFQDSSAHDCQFQRRAEHSAQPRNGPSWQLRCALLAFPAQTGQWQRASLHADSVVVSPIVHRTCPQPVPRPHVHHGDLSGPRLASHSVHRGPVGFFWFPFSNSGRHGKGA